MSMPFRRLSEFDLNGRRLLIREDLNVPIEGGVIRSDQRLKAALPTVRLAQQAGAAVLLMSHLGRPKEGLCRPEDSLAPVAAWFARELHAEVPLLTDLDKARPEPGQVAMLENVRCNVGEKADDPVLARRYAALCDLYVMDAFATAHRAEASTHGVGLVAPAACAGPLLEAELDALGKALVAPQRPLLAIIGGAKVSTKLDVLANLLERVDALIVGGGMANTFLAARGVAVGRSLHEPDCLQAARDILARAAAAGKALALPIDAVLATRCAAEVPTRIAAIDAVADDEMILDVGPETSRAHAGLIAGAGTIVWNGPVGVFELAPFAAGTRALTEAVCAAEGYSLAGGGDTLAALEQFAPEGGIDYVSTGGGAFLEFLEGRTLPAVAMLARRASG